jgi:hypothetical protein
MRVTIDEDASEGKVIIKELDATEGFELDRFVWSYIIVGIITSPPITTSTTLPVPSVPPSTTPTTSDPPEPSPNTTTPAPTVPGTQPPDLSLEQQFIEAGIAFNTPSRMSLGETVTVQLILGEGRHPEDLGGSITAPGNIESERLNTTCETTARLQGHNFDVLELTEATQFVCAGLPAEWRWDLTARVAGFHRLTLALSATIEDNPPFTISVYQRDIEIQVGFLTRLWTPMAENLEIAITGVVAAMATVFGTRLARRRSKGAARARGTR